VIDTRAKFDLAGLEMPSQRDQAEAVGPDGDDAHRPIPWPWHSHDVLVAQRERPVAVELLERCEFGGRDAVEVGSDPLYELFWAKVAANHACAVDPVHERTDPVAGALHVAEVGFGSQLGPGVI
jgi:hypothetical protein